MLSGRLPKKNYESNSGALDSHEYGLSMMSLGVDMPPGLAGVEPDSSLRGRKQMAEIQGGPPQGDQVKDFSNLNNDSMILDHHRGSQDSLDPTKLYALSA